jgi:hypothetical protein
LRKRIISFNFFVVVVVVVTFIYSNAKSYSKRISQDTRGAKEESQCSLNKSFTFIHSTLCSALVLFLFSSCCLCACLLAFIYTVCVYIFQFSTYIFGLVKDLEREKAFEMIFFFSFILSFFLLLLTHSSLSIIISQTKKKHKTIVNSIKISTSCKKNEWVKLSFRIINRRIGTRWEEMSSQFNLINFTKFIRNLIKYIIEKISN